MEIKTVDDFITKAENDSNLRNLINDSYNGISGKLQYSTGSILEKEGIGGVKAFLKDKKNNARYNQKPAYDTLFKYCEIADSLEISPSIKGFLIRKLNSIVKTKISGGEK